MRAAHEGLNIQLRENDEHVFSSKAYQSRFAVVDAASATMKKEATHTRASDAQPCSGAAAADGQS